MPDDEDSSSLLGRKNLEACEGSLMTSSSGFCLAAERAIKERKRTATATGVIVGEAYGDVDTNLFNRRGTIK